MKKIYWALLCILVIISSFVLAQVYSTFEIPIRVTTPTPSEFLNGTSICYIGGSQGILNCTGNVTGSYIFGNLTYATGIGSFPGWTNVAWQNQTNIFIKNQNMSNNNLTDVNYIKFTSGGYVYDNGTALILGHT